jgi:hypothetical protein
VADPHRLLSQVSDADELERALLGSLRHVEPPADAQGEAWARLSTQIAAVGLLGAAQASTAAVGTSTAAANTASSSLGLASLPAKLLGSKLVVGLALAGGVLGASVLSAQFRSSPLPAPTSTAAPSARAPSLESIAPIAPALESVSPTGPQPSPALTIERPAKPSSEANPTDRLNAESALLMQARAQLRSGDTAGAQQSLTRLRANFPKGVLGQEREVLTIEVLAARGNMEAARRRANAFIVAYPKSPHSAQLRRFTDTP